jgi:hypothetical protein
MSNTAMLLRLRPRHSRNKCKGDDYADAPRENDGCRNEANGQHQWGDEEDQKKGRGHWITQAAKMYQNKVVLSAQFPCSKSRTNAA